MPINGKSFINIMLNFDKFKNFYILFYSCLNSKKISSLVEGKERFAKYNIPILFKPKKVSSPARVFRLTMAMVEVSCITYSNKPLTPLSTIESTDERYL